MKYAIFSVVLLCSSVLYGQQTSGTITYNRNMSWVNVMSKLPFMTKDEIERSKMSWGKNEGRSQAYLLTFNSKNSLYTHAEEEYASGYSRRVDDYLIIRDYENKTCHDQVDFLGKTYIVQEDTPRIKWKILNEIQEIAGYICMKAETYDPVRNVKIQAWFTDEIPVYGGPEGFGGLPGMILYLVMNDDDVVIEATKVTLSDEALELPIPKKMKGKQIKREELNAKQKKYITETIEARRNPYWQMRY